VCADGVAVFDHNGKHRFGYRSKMKASAVEIMDCYAACPVVGDTIAFYSYPGFPLVQWNLRTGEQSITPLPAELFGARGLASINEHFYFYSSYKHQNAGI